MTSLIPHLVHFARDQLAVIKGWQGQAYVEACLKVWEEAYGSGIAASVRQQLGDALPRHGRPTSSHAGGG